MAIRSQFFSELEEGPKGLGSNIYEYDWYSGSQIVIMIGDVVIDSAVAVQFEVEQTKTPVYGYANQYYTFVADGHVLVSGVLTIAFKEAGYLFWPIQKYIETAGPARTAGPGAKANWNNSPRVAVGEDGSLSRGYTPGGDYSLMAASNAASDKKKKWEIIRSNVEQSAQIKSGQGGDASALRNFWNELGSLPDDEFENWVEVFEDAIWYGSDDTNPLTRDKLYSKNISEEVVSISDEEVLQHRRIDQYPAVDIWITYGDYSRGQPNHTVRKLMDVSFTGTSQSIEISGQPTYEQYRFIARNVI